MEFETQIKIGDRAWLLRHPVIAEVRESGIPLHLHNSVLEIEGCYSAPVPYFSRAGEALYIRGGIIWAGMIWAVSHIIDVADFHLCDWECARYRSRNPLPLNSLWEPLLTRLGLVERIPAWIPAPGHESLVKELPQDDPPFWTTLPAHAAEELVRQGGIMDQPDEQDYIEASKT